MIHLDTSFLVDLLREQARGAPGPASAWLAARQDERLAASIFVLCELEAGAARATHPVRERTKIARMAQVLTVVGPGDGFAHRYGATLGEIHRRAKSIATMDLLNATTALLGKAPLVTADVRHFDAVSDLELLSYRS